jgi:hypothetical protein
MIGIPRDRWDDLRIRLARAEAQAAERDLALADARLALRALTAGPADTHGAAPVPQIHTAPPVTGAVADAPPPAAATPSPAPIVVPAAPHLGSEAPTPAAPGTSSEPGSAASPMSASTTVDPAAQVAMARSEAARTGGYVPAVSAPPKRRRWWQSRRADA